MDEKSNYKLTFSKEHMNAQEITSLLNKVRANAPLVHNITNYVVMNNTANALLSIGASPVMAHAIEEVEDMCNIAGVLVINMGTLSPHWVEAMIKAGKRAVERNIPIVFDPVGMGATPYRNQTAKQIIEECKPTIIRGNASEIMALNNADIKTKGVDSTQAAESAVEAAKELAIKCNTTVVISGETDFITNGEETFSIKNGSELMPKVTGMGCTATAINGSFAAIENDQLKAATAAMAIMGICGEMAAEKSNGPGSLQMNFIDALFQISEKDIENKLILTNE